MRMKQGVGPAGAQAITFTTTFTILFATQLASAGDISGRREGTFGDGTHESLIWAVGVGNNPLGSHGIALSWFGNFAITGLPAGQYYVAGNAHGPAPHNIIDTPITVPSSGTVNLDLHDRITMGTQGLTDLGQCTWAAQTFVATGPDLDEVVVVSPNGGTFVRISIREGGPDGPQIGPGKTVENGSLFPRGARWAPGEVPLVPGRLYAVRFDLTSGGTWAPALGYRANRYPNGHAWIDGQPIPEADLKVNISCRDTGFIEDYHVSNWWRNNRYHELVQTFVSQGQELRLAQMMLAGDGGYTFRASVHQWSGNYPPGAQVGVAKHAGMSKDLPQAFVWGPAEAPLTPGQTYALRFVRADGGDFAIYGNSDNYSQGQAYFDGSPDNGIDMHGTIVTRERDRGDIVISNFTLTPLSATEIRATFSTSVSAVATVAHAIGSPPFDTITPADPTPRTSHDITIPHLERHTSYDIWPIAHNETRNVLADRGNALSASTLDEDASFSGHVRSQKGPVSGAEIILEEAGLTTQTDASGNFSFSNAPTGQHTLTVRAVSISTATRQVYVTADGLGHAEVMVTLHTNLLAGSDSNPMAGWTAFGYFNGEFNSGNWSIQARTGPKWMGYVANWPDMSAGDHGGGVYRTLAVESGRAYRIAGYVLTNAYGSDHDPISGLAVGRIGVDLTAGTDPNSPTVTWTRFRFTSGEWMEHAIDFTATGSSVTLFTDHKWEYFYETPVWFVAGYDDLWLGRRTRPLPDFDLDLDVDLNDFGDFQICLSGPGITQSDPACQFARLDDDEDVDQDDLILFRGCMSAPGTPAAPDCAEE